MDILTAISDKDRLDFSQNLSITRNYMGDTLFPDVKSENLTAEYFRLSDGMKLPSMAHVHAFDTEANIGQRPTIEKVTVEKLLIKEKINQTERIKLLVERGVSDNNIINYVFDDMGRTAESVKTRTEVAKMELIATGKITVKENNLDFSVDYGVTNRKNFDWTNDQHDVLGDIQTMIDAAKAKGSTVNRAITSNHILSLLRKNKTIQTAIYGSNGVGTFVSNNQINSLFGDMFGISVAVNDEQYKFEGKNNDTTSARYFPKDKFTLMQVNANGSIGTGLWGVTPEEEGYGQYSAKSAQQFITITQWATPDPVAVWTKASGLFIPVLPDPDGIVIGTIKG